MWGPGHKDVKEKDLVDEEGGRGKGSGVLRENKLDRLSKVLN